MLNTMHSAPKGQISCSRVFPAICLLLVQVLIRHLVNCAVVGKIARSVIENQNNVAFHLTVCNMPLIVISGFPASGKSFRAQQLKEFLQKTTEKKVVTLCENDVVKSHSVYSGMLLYASCH